MWRLNILTLWVFLALAWLAPQTAVAGRGVVTIDLKPTTGQVPTHLCVVSEAPGPRTRDQLWSYLEPDPAGPTVAGQQRWRMLPRAWDGDFNQTPLTCANDPKADCRAEVRLPTGMSKGTPLHAACTADTLFTHSSTTNPRVLVLILEQLDASPPDIETVRLTGGIATIGLATFMERAVITARSLGGHYLPHARNLRESESGSNTKKIGQFTIDPRCRWTEVKLPRTSLEPGDRPRLSVRVHDVEIDRNRCVGGLGGDAFRVLVPRAEIGVGSLEVTVDATEESAGANFGAYWDGSWPPAPFDLKFRQINFTWKRPACIFTDHACPKATLDTGTVCDSEVTPLGCRYTCPGQVSENALDLELPVEVTFEKEDPRQRWTDKLAQNGQQLSSYVSPEDIHLQADLKGWRTENPGNEIQKVRFFLPSGETAEFSVTHSPNLLVQVGGATCQPIRYEIVGDRKYDEGRASVEDGELRMRLAHEGARVVSFNAMLAAGGGPAWSPLTDTEVFFNGLLQFGMRFRPRRPRIARLGFEARVAAMLGQWGIVVFEDDPATIENEGKTVEDFVWSRFLLGPGLVTDVSRRIGLGVGVDLGASFPARTQDRLRGDQFTFIVSPNLDVRVRIRRWLSFVIQFRGVIDKAFGVPSPMSDPAGTDEPTTRTAGTFMTLFGLAATF